MTGRAALEYLGLDHDATVDQVRTRYHLRALTAHPDRGGSNEAMHELQAAYSTAWAYASRRRRCPDCDGAGWVDHRRGVQVLRARCRACRGSGGLNYEQEER